MTTTPETSDTAQDIGPEFHLPDHIAQDPEMVSMYHRWIRALTAEARGLPMHTVQEFLLERIATKYVIMKYRERNNEWLGVRTENDFTAQWLDLVKEWNKVLSSGQDKLRDAVLEEVQGIALESLQMIRDEDDRKRVRLHYKERFAAMGH